MNSDFVSLCCSKLVSPESRTEGPPGTVMRICHPTSNVERSPDSVMLNLIQYHAETELTSKYRTNRWIKSFADGT